MVDRLRRRLLGGSAAAFGVVLLGGCDAGGDDPPSTDAGEGGEEGAPTAGDLDLLGAAAMLERSLADTYRAIATARAADLEALGLAERFRLFGEHHGEHARALELLTGEVEPSPPLAGFVVPTVEDVAELTAQQLTTDLRRLEDVLTQTYLDAVGRLSQPALRQAVVSIGAAEAAHGVVLDLLLAGGLAGYDANTTPAGRYPLDRSAFG